MSLLVYASVVDAISPRVFGLCGILLMLGLFIGLMYRLRVAQTTKGEQESNSSPQVESVQVNHSIKKLRISIIVMLILLLYGLWATRSGPLFPRLVGAAMNLTFTAGLVLQLRRAKNADSAR